MTNKISTKSKEFNTLKCEVTTYVLFILLFITCSPNTQLTGNSSETINGIRIICSSTSITGTTRSSATVDIYSKDYWPHIAIDSQKHSDFIYAQKQKTGDNGSFTFKNLKPGHYNLIVTDSSKTELCYFSELQVLPDTIFNYESDSLYKSGTIQGLVSKEESTKNHSIIFIPGSPYFVETNSDGSFLITDVPKGTFSLYLDYTTSIKGIKVDTIESTQSFIKKLGSINVESDSVSTY